MIDNREDVINSDDIKSLIKSQNIARKIYCFNELPSTNDEAKKYIDKKDNDGAVFVASCQKQGKGRLGRKWVSPEGGVYFSLLLMPRQKDVDLSRFYIASSVAVCLSIEKFYSFKTYIKWPNDIIIKNKKVAGILAETLHGRLGQEYLIVGIGINVNSLSSQLPEGSMSLWEASGKYVKRNEIIAMIINYLDKYYSDLKENNLKNIYKLWNRHCYQLGLRVEISYNNDIISGMIMGVDESSGALLIRRDNGIIESIKSADEIKIMGSKK
jgi:BirA family biotin operon repressor/biotin-[acetyl-CoA-carboxylase] ligase